MLKMELSVNKFYSSKELVEKMMKHFEVVESGNSILQKKSWSQFVGEKFAAHSKLIEIKNHTALIETDHPGWVQQILWKKKLILKNFSTLAPELEITAISVRTEKK